MARVTLTINDEFWADAQAELGSATAAQNFMIRALWQEVRQRSLSAFIEPIRETDEQEMIAVVQVEVTRLDDRYGPPPDVTAATAPL